MVKTVAYLNTNGKEPWVYNGINQNDQVVGQIDPPQLDLELIDSLRIPVQHGRECQLVEGTCDPRPVPDYDIYFSDYVTLHCNYECPYCLTDSPEITKTKKFLRIAPDDKMEWLRYFSNFVPVGQSYYYRIFGGEPTIYPGFYSMVDFLNRDAKCSTCNISTNAHSSKFVEHFLQVHISREKFTIFIGIHPIDPRFNWERTKSHIVSLHEAGYSVTLIGVYTNKEVEILRKYSDELFRHIGLRIPIFENLREDKYK